MPALGLRWDPKPEMTADLRFPSRKSHGVLIKTGVSVNIGCTLPLGLGNRWGIREPDGNDTEIRLNIGGRTWRKNGKVEAGGFIYPINLASVFGM